MVSNPYSLGLQAAISKAHNTYDGNVVYRLVRPRRGQPQHPGSSWRDPPSSFPCLHTERVKQRELGEAPALVGRGQAAVTTWDRLMGEAWAACRERPRVRWAHPGARAGHTREGQRPQASGRTCSVDWPPLGKPGSVHRACR